MIEVFRELGMNKKMYLNTLSSLRLYGTLAFFLSWKCNAILKTIYFLCSSSLN